MTRATRVPLFLKARTKDLLIKEMLKNNVKNNVSFDYFDIQKDGKNWIAWFFVDLQSPFRKEIIRESK